MKNEIENIFFSRFVKHKIPFDFVTIQELYETISGSKFDIN